MKPFLTFEQQLALLKERGLKISTSEEEVVLFLQENNYYRLSGYFKLFVKDGTDEFIEHFSFEQLRSIYIFDFELRRVLNDMLEEVEVTVKTQIAYHLAKCLAPDFYMHNKYFHNKGTYNNFVKEVKKEIERNNQNPIVTHHKGMNIPIWALVELLSFGTISKMYSNLLPEYQKCVSSEGNYYSYNYKAFRSYLYVAAQLRNRCSHRGRLYGKNILANISYSKGDIALFNQYQYKYRRDSSSTIFQTIYASFKLLNNSQSKNYYINKIQELFIRYGHNINPNMIGFYDNWDLVLKG